MYKVVIGLENFGTFSSDKDAVFAFIDKIKQTMNESEVVSWQWLNECCWIEYKGIYWKGFYEVRDYAYEQGWMKDGELVNE